MAIDEKSSEMEQANVPMDYGIAMVYGQIEPWMSWDGLLLTFDIENEMSRTCTVMGHFPQQIVYQLCVPHVQREFQDPEMEVHWYHMFGHILWGDSLKFKGVKQRPYMWQVPPIQVPEMAIDAMG